MTRIIEVLFLSAAMVLTGSTSAHAQRSSDRTKLFIAEAVGGIAGSLIGASAGIARSEAVDSCDADDVVCHPSTELYGGIGGAIGASLGAMIGASARNARPSPAAVVAGSLLGAVAGLAAVQAATGSTDLRAGGEGPQALVVFSLVQGVTVATVSRALRRNDKH
jgi:hypothetical protein